jgi:hypothetical protein
LSILSNMLAPSERLPWVPVLGSSDKIHVSGVALCLRLFFMPRWADASGTSSCWSP